MKKRWRIKAEGSRKWFINMFKISIYTQRPGVPADRSFDDQS